MKNTPIKIPMQSVQELRHRITNSDLNSKQVGFGGLLFMLADKMAGHAAEAHQEDRCLTRSSNFEFLDKVKLRDEMLFRATVYRTWKNSILVGVEGFILLSDGEKHLFAHGYFILVPIDDNLRLIPSKFVIHPTDQKEKERFKAAPRIKRSLLKLSQIRKQLE